MFKSPVCFCQTLELLWLIQKNSYLLSDKFKCVFDASLGQENTPRKRKKLSRVSYLFSMSLTFPLCFGDRTESQVHRSSLNPSLNTQQVHGSACLGRSHSDCMKSSTAVAFIHKTQPAFSLVLFFISYFLPPLLSFKDIFKRVKRPLFLSTTESGPHLPDTPEIQ